MLRVVAVAALGFGPGAALASDGYPALVPLEGLLEAAGGGRLEAGGAGRWEVVRAAPGERVVQGALAHTLDLIGKERGHGFYRGAVAQAIAAAVAARGGTLAAGDLAAHDTPVLAPLTLALPGATLHVQPPMTQGVLLAMALQALDRLRPGPGAALEHAAVEATLSAFAHRDRVAEGAALMALPLEVDMACASGRSGPRAYLHTAGVAAADAAGMVVSSLVSVFDEFGAAVFVPEGGFVLNNRAAGFTDGPNAPAPGRRPVHTLAPALVELPSGLLALATPGADGQVQVLLQLLGGLLFGQATPDLAALIDRPRWRSENGRLLIDSAHPHAAALAARGHDLVRLPGGDMRFGAVVAAGLADGVPFAGADWRRTTWATVT